MPLVTVVTSGRSLRQRGQGSLSRLLRSGRPVHVIVQDEVGAPDEAEDLSAFHIDLGYLAMAHREVFAVGSTLARPGRLTEGLVRMVRAPRPGVALMHLPAQSWPRGTHCWPRPRSAGEPALTSFMTRTPEQAGPTASIWRGIPSRIAPGRFTRSAIWRGETRRIWRWRSPSPTRWPWSQRTCVTCASSRGPPGTMGASGPWPSTWRPSTWRVASPRSRTCGSSTKTKPSSAPS